MLLASLLTLSRRFVVSVVAAVVLAVVVNGVATANIGKVIGVD